MKCGICFVNVVRRKRRLEGRYKLFVKSVAEKNMRPSTIITVVKNVMKKPVFVMNVVEDYHKLIGLRYK